MLVFLRKLKRFGLCGPTEQNQHDVREDVASTETLLQTEHHQEGAGTKTSVQVCVSEPALVSGSAHSVQCFICFFVPSQVHENPRRDHERADGAAGTPGVGHRRTNLHQGGMLRRNGFYFQPTATDAFRHVESDICSDRSQRALMGFNFALGRYVPV